jgi:hypothetical protein
MEKELGEGRGWFPQSMVLIDVEGFISWSSMISYGDLDGNSTDRCLQIMTGFKTSIFCLPCYHTRQAPFFRSG